MNKTSIIIFIVIILIVGFVAYSYSQSTPASTGNTGLPPDQGGQQPLAQGPQIKISPEFHDFGTVIYGDVAEYNFTVTNAGNQPLKILRLSTSCGCTEASMVEADKIIAPGKSVPLIVTFDPAVMKDNPSLGPVMRVVYIKSNDPNNSEIEVIINAFVIKEVK